MEANGLESLLSNFTSDADVHVQTQALGAISCKPGLIVYSEGLGDETSSKDSICCLCYVALIRHNKAGVSAFKLADGYTGLRDALASDSVRFQR